MPSSADRRIASTPFWTVKRTEWGGFTERVGVKTPQGVVRIIASDVQGDDLDRFAVDTGSLETVVAQPFLKQSGARWNYDGGENNFDYLEGPLRVRPAIVDWLQVGEFRFTRPRVTVAQDDPTNVEFPLDGILANQMLDVFEWWYDYDGNRVWIKRD